MYSPSFYLELSDLENVRVRKNQTTTLDNQIFPTHLSTFTKGFGDGVASPMGVWGASPPVEFMDLIDILEITYSFFVISVITVP